MRFWWSDPPTTDEIPIDEGFRKFCSDNGIRILTEEMPVEMVMLQALWRKTEK